ncbi:hypothetical protein PANDA_008661 [Ailuropoda melanoleuca]|uniref:Uncharacterized protein n=1 Tax=Ailuropoda melanoleuca TaxID=9646 RepID=D2HDA8_AILME|nr:hypothetical protein PANDA_008661 [Ailuropoda melanoleuca]
MGTIRFTWREQSLYRDRRQGGEVRGEQMPDARLSVELSKGRGHGSFLGLVILPRSTRPRQTGCVRIYFGHTAANTGFMKLFGARLPGGWCAKLLLSQLSRRPSPFLLSLRGQYSGSHGLPVSASAAPLTPHRALTTDRGDHVMSVTDITQKQEGQPTDPAQQVPDPEEALNVMFPIRLATPSRFPISIHRGHSTQQVLPSDAPPPPRSPVRPVLHPHLQSTPSHTWLALFRKRGLPALKQPKCTAHSALEAQSSSEALSTTRPICFCASLTPSRTTEANGDRKLETSGAHRFQLICTADLQNSDNPEVSRRHLTATFNIYSFTLFSHFKRHLIAKAEMKGSWNSLSRLDRTDSKAAKVPAPEEDRAPLAAASTMAQCRWVGGGAPRDLPCRRAPFLLKKVLPGQMGGPDVLQQKRNQSKRGLVDSPGCTWNRHLSKRTAQKASKHFPNDALWTPSENASLKTTRERERTLRRSKVASTAAHSDLPGPGGNIPEMAILEKALLKHLDKKDPGPQKPQQRAWQDRPESKTRTMPSMKTRDSSKWMTHHPTKRSWVPITAKALQVLGAERGVRPAVRTGWRQVAVLQRVYGMMENLAFPIPRLQLTLSVDSGMYLWLCPDMTLGCHPTNPQLWELDYLLISSTSSELLLAEGPKRPVGHTSVVQALAEAEDGHRHFLRERRGAKGAHVDQRAECLIHSLCPPWTTVWRRTAETAGNDTPVFISGRTLNSVTSARVLEEDQVREWTENRGRKTRQEAVGESPRSGRESQDRDTGKGYRKDRLKRHFEGKINRIWYLNQETNQRPFLTLDTGLKGKKTANTEKFKWESRFRSECANPLLSSQNWTQASAVEASNVEKTVKHEENCYVGYKTRPQMAKGNAGLILALPQPDLQGFNEGSYRWFNTITALGDDYNLVREMAHEHTGPQYKAISAKYHPGSEREQAYPGATDADLISFSLLDPVQSITVQDQLRERSQILIITQIPSRHYTRNPNTHHGTSPLRRNCSALGVSKTCQLQRRNTHPFSTIQLPSHSFLVHPDSSDSHIQTCEARAKNGDSGNHYNQLAVTAAASNSPPAGPAGVRSTASAGRQKAGQGAEGLRNSLGQPEHPLPIIHAQLSPTSLTAFRIISKCSPIWTETPQGGLSHTEEINFSPSGKVRSLTTMQNAGQPLFTNTAQQCLRRSEQESAWSSSPLALHWLSTDSSGQQIRRESGKDPRLLSLKATLAMVESPKGSRLSWSSLSWALGTLQSKAGCHFTKTKFQEPQYPNNRHVPSCGSADPTENEVKARAPNSQPFRRSVMMTETESRTKWVGSGKRTGRGPSARADATVQALDNQVAAGRTRRKGGFRRYSEPTGRCNGLEVTEHLIYKNTAHHSLPPAPQPYTSTQGSDSNSCSSGSLKTGTGASGAKRVGLVLWDWGGGADGNRHTGLLVCLYVCFVRGGRWPQAQPITSLPHGPHKRPLLGFQGWESSFWPQHLDITNPVHLEEETAFPAPKNSSTRNQQRRSFQPTILWVLVKIWALSVGVEGKAKFVGGGEGVLGNALLRRARLRTHYNLRHWPQKTALQRSNQKLIRLITDNGTRRHDSKRETKSAKGPSCHHSLGEQVRCHQHLFLQLPDLVQAPSSSWTLTGHSASCCQAFATPNPLLSHSTLSMLPHLQRLPGDTETALPSRVPRSLRNRGKHWTKRSWCLKQEEHRCQLGGRTEHDKQKGQCQAPLPREVTLREGAPTLHLLGVRGAVAHEGVERGTEDKFHISVLPDPSDTLTLQMWKGVLSKLGGQGDKESKITARFSPSGTRRMRVPFTRSADLQESLCKAPPDILRRQMTAECWAPGEIQQRHHVSELSFLNRSSANLCAVSEARRVGVAVHQPQPGESERHRGPLERPKITLSTATESPSTLTAYTLITAQERPFAHTEKVFRRMSSARMELHAGTSLKPFRNPPRMHDTAVQAAAPSSRASGRNVLPQLTAWTLVIGGRPEPVMGGHPQCLTKAWTREDNPSPGIQGSKPTQLPHELLEKRTE